MPLDVGPHAYGGRSTEVDRLGVDRATLGLALKAQRQSLDLTLAAVARRTRVREAYLKAIEDSAWERLPSGPFVAGYVKLYAGAVGLNGDKAVAAFREEQPAEAPSLRAPPGLSHERTRRISPLALLAVGAVIAAVVGWNVVQRVSAVEAAEAALPPPVEADWVRGSAPPLDPVVRIAAATAPPPDQNAPTPYETPGLAASVAQAQGATPLPVALTAAPAQPEVQAPVGAAFNPRAAVHGAPPQLSRVTVQARRSASVVVRRPDGAILFARQLAAGEAWRAPLDAGLVIDVSDPAHFDVYRDGEFQGQLREPQTRLDRVLG